MLKMKVRVGDLAEIEVEGATQQDVWKQAAFWHSLPTVCPVDNTPVRFGFRQAGKDFPFFSLLSSGPMVYEFKLGQSDRGLFPGKVIKTDDGEATVQRWSYYDHQTKQEVVVWQDGKLLGGKVAGKVEDPVVVHRNVTSDEDLTGVVNEAFGINDNPFNDPPKPTKSLGLITKAQSGTMHALGLAVAGSKEAWDAGRPASVIWASDKRVTSSAELTQAEANKLIARLEEKLRKKFEALAQDYLEAGIEIGNVDPDELFGVELANSYRVAATLKDKVTA